MQRYDTNSPQVQVCFTLHGMNLSIEQHHKAAIAALNKGNLPAVAQHCQKIVQSDSSHADAWFLLGIVAASRGQMREALGLMDKALDLEPNQADYLAQKAKILCQLKQDHAARACAEAARVQKPRGALILDTLGVVYTNLGDYQTACELLRQAVALQPGHVQFQFNLATAEQFLGNTDAAKNHYEKAIELQPRFARAYWALSELEKECLDGSRTVQLEQLMNAPQLNSEDALYLAHALSREYERVGNYEKAFNLLQQAKQKRRSQLNYNLQNDITLFDVLSRHFQALSPQPDISSNMGEECIFIVGMPRSGTTLVERILSSHSLVESLGELHNLGLAVRQSVVSNSRLMLDEEIITKALQASPASIGERYLNSVCERRGTAHHFIDKMPLNFLYIGFIAQCLPGAKIVCVQRNPMDSCLSNFRQLFAMNFSYYNYHYSIEDTARYIVAFRELMQFWEEIFPGKIHNVQYEELTKNPEKEISELLGYCRLGWQDGCMNFHKNRTAVATPSAAQVREKLYTRAVGRWHKYHQQLQPAQRIFDAANLPYQ